MSVDIANLENIKNKVESMSKTNQIEILKILKRNSSIKLNEKISRLGCRRTKKRNRND